MYRTGRYSIPVFVRLYRQQTEVQLLVPKNSYVDSNTSKYYLFSTVRSKSKTTMEIALFYVFIDFIILARTNKYQSHNNIPYLKGLSHEIDFDNIAKN